MVGVTREREREFQRESESAMKETYESLVLVVFGGEGYFSQSMKKIVSAASYVETRDVLI